MYVYIYIYVCVHTFWHFFWHFIWQSGIYSDILSGILSGIYSDILSDISDMGTAGPQPRAPDLSGHCHAEAWQCPLSGRKDGRKDGWKEGGKEEEATLIKSRDPHLAGGEEYSQCPPGSQSPRRLRVKARNRLKACYRNIWELEGKHFQTENNRNMKLK